MRATARRSEVSLGRFLPRVPLTATVRGYSWETGRSDLVAGLTVAVMLVPQAMAYAALAGMPPETGLYASLLPVVVYAVFGTSGQLAVGPVAIVALLTATTIEPLAGGDPDRYLLLAGLLALMVGAMMLLLGLLRAGRIVSFLSHSVISGFTSAAAIVIALSQVPSLIGTEKLGDGSFVATIRHMGDYLAGLHPLTALIGLAGIGILLLARRLPRVPGPLLLLLLATASVAAFDLADRGVEILGRVPAGLPALSVPALDGAAIVDLLPGALTIALLSYAEGISVAKAIASRTKQRVDPNQELVAVGAANLAAGVVGAFPVAGGFSRSAVNHQAGARTPVASLVTVAGIAVALLVATPLLAYVPDTVLAAVVVTAVLGLVDVRGALEVARFRLVDGAVLGLTFLVTLLVNIELGLAVGVGASIVVFLARTSRPRLVELGSERGTGLFRDRQHREVVTDPRALLLRVDGPLYFASAANLVERIGDRLSGDSHLELLVVDVAAVNDLDADAEHALARLSEEARAASVRLVLTSVRAPIRQLLTRSGLYERLGPLGIMENVKAAVHAWDPASPLASVAEEAEAREAPPVPVR
jgi:sulfate permease, SulP family